MTKKYSFTKTSILSGIQCHKKLWFDLHQKIPTGDKALFRMGNRFNDVVRQHYGQGLDLSNIFNYELALSKTHEAIQSEKIKVIYEGAFMYNDIFIRADVLIRKENQWIMLEAKASTGVKDINIDDVAIQNYVAKHSGLEVIQNKLIHINKDFVYQGDNNYSDLIIEQDISDEVLVKEKEIENLIHQLKPLIDSPCPSIQVGAHCKNPYPCQYFDLVCSPPETDIQNVSYKILPYHGKKIEEYCKENQIEKLKDIPKELLQNSRKDYAEHFHYIIQQAHINNTTWINQDIQKHFKDWVWPYYFMDFETVQQAVPIIKNSKPFEQLPFQWSVHKWTSPDQPLEEFSFLEFNHQDMELHFLTQLIETLGDQGTIFVHNHPFEKGVLNRLKEKPNLKSYALQIDNIIERIADTLELTRKNFYSPEMFGKYSLKKIVKGIPTKISYEAEDENSVSDGGDAQLAWFKCTDPDAKESDKAIQREELIKYCSKDTEAMYDLIVYFLKQGKNK
jgi:hypothetical protein